MSGSEIFVAATSENSTTSYDYRILKFTSNFNLGWTNTYDYAGLVEVPVGLDVSGGSDVSITGASASSANSWDYALALFDQTTGNYISDVRNNIAGTGIDHALGHTKDASGNIYVTGKSWNGSDFNIKTVKISSTYSIAWTATLDVNGFDDVASSIATDASGNVIIGGYAMEYSILSKNKAVSINEKNADDLNITIMPNPAKDIQFLMINGNGNCECTVELYDVMGRKIKEVFKGKTDSAITSIVNSISELSNSLYFYIITIDEKKIVKKFVKID